MEPLKLRYSVLYSASVNPTVFYARCGYCNWEQPYPLYGEASRMAAEHWRETHTVPENFEVET